MEENTKQRLVGAGVLVALAVIFLPALFDKNERVEIDITSQIPPSPQIEPVTISLPTKPEGIKVPPSGKKLFEPSVTEAIKSTKENDKKPEEANKESVSQLSPTNTAPPKEVSPKPAKPLSKPSLNSKGVPIAWVIQASSFKSEKSAEAFTAKLSSAGYKSYMQSVRTEQGPFYRVLIGPYIDESKANKAKAKVDKAYQVKSKVLRFNPISGD